MLRSRARERRGESCQRISERIERIRRAVSPRRIAALDFAIMAHVALLIYLYFVFSLAERKNEMQKEGYDAS